MAIYKGTEKVDLAVFNNKANGTEYTGSTEITPGVVDVTILKDTYLPSNVTISGDANLKPENILKGKEVFGVQGSFTVEAFPNGTEWTQSNIIDGQFDSVYYSNGIWVAGNNNNTNYIPATGVYYSVDGKNWVQGNITDKRFFGIYNANGIWVAGCVGGGLYYSTDGKNWTHSNITTGTFECIYNANGIWVAGYDGGGIYYSTDGKTWTQSNITDGGFISVYYANGLWVAAEYNYQGLLWSEDGKNWTQSNTMGMAFCVYNANGIWAAGLGNDDHYGLFVSQDGKQWNPLDNIEDYIEHIYSANGIWVVTTSSSGIYYSTDLDLVNWTQSNITNGEFLNTQICNANGIWIIGGNDGLLYSTDGKIWMQSNITSLINPVYNANGLWVAGSTSYDKTGKGLYYSVSWEPSA